ncbi:MAG: hypothetical protein VKO44_02790 [Cyanobacteriota bacterium]|nr:hypothetical protein [Cyanobacteriota bacterium]
MAFRRGLNVACLALAGCLLLMALAQLSPPSLTTDELLEYQGVVDHVRFAAQVLRGGKPDLHDAIVYNLENYGIVAKLPAYLLSRLAGEGEPADYASLVRNATPYQLYFQLSHLTSLLFGLASVAVVFVVARLMDLRLPWSAALILLLTPRFMGDGLFNIKDIPFAFFYLLYSTSLLLRLRRPLEMGAALPAPFLLFSALAAGLMGSMKIIALVAVLFTEGLLTVIQSRRCRWIDGVHICLDAGLLALLLTPSSWLEPLRFLNGAIKLFRSHDWPGGTWWNGEFLSRVQDPSHWSTGGYLWRWIPSATPVWILLLAFLGAASLVLLAFRETVRSRSDRALTPPGLPLLFLPFSLQLLLLPGLAVVGQGNLYDGVRHLLFLYPPLALLASIGVDRLRALASGSGRVRFWRGALVALAVLAALTLVDTLTLFPYGYVYTSEPMRFFLSPANTAYDYWVYAGTDAARAALRTLPDVPPGPPACLARVELPDPVKAMLAPELRGVACSRVDAPAPPARPLVLRLVNGARPGQPTCHSVARWQWPGFRRTLATACLDPLPVAPPSP